MPKFLKYLLIGLLSLVVLVLAAVALIAATFNPNDYKPASLNWFSRPRAARWRSRAISA